MTRPIIDAHHHIWRRADKPWLQGATVPRIFGEYDAIKRDYPMSEFLSDLQGSNVAKSVYVNQRRDHLLRSFDRGGAILEPVPQAVERVALRRQQVARHELLVHQRRGRIRLVAISRKAVRFASHRLKCLAR